MISRLTSRKVPYATATNAGFRVIIDRIESGPGQKLLFIAYAMLRRQLELGCQSLYLHAFVEHALTNIRQGEQHKHIATSANPFEEVKPHVNEYTAQEIATLSSRLEKQLGPEYISARPGAGGGKVHYLSADKCINLANEVFGFNGWSSAIQNVQIDFVRNTRRRISHAIGLIMNQVDENQSTGKVNLGLSVIVRVTLRDGTYHEVIECSFSVIEEVSEQSRISATDTSRIAKAKLQHSKKQRKKAQQTDSSGLCVILVTSSEIVCTTKTMSPK